MQNSVADFNGDGRPDPVTANCIGTTGVWGYNRTAGTGVNLDPRNATALVAAANGNVVANFAGAGVVLRGSIGAWTNISRVVAE